MHTPHPISVLLHNVRSAHNVGSVFRTAEAAGVSHLYLTGYTPTPLDRFGRPRRDISKTALGAEDVLSWSRHTRITPLLRQLAACRVQRIAVEQGSGSCDYRGVVPRMPCVFVYGNEVRGLSSQALECVDVVAEIPLLGIKQSLNVSVAAGVSLFRMIDNAPGVATRGRD